MKSFVLAMPIACLMSCSVSSQGTHSVPIESKNNRTYVTIKLANITIPDILLDTGFSFDGVMLFNPSYRDSFNISRAADVKIGGAGSGEGQKAIMIDSVNLSLGNQQGLYHPVIIMNKNPGFTSNGIIGYSIFGHYTTEFDYDRKEMILHDPGKFHADSTWTSLPIYFKDNKIPWLDVAVVIEQEEPIRLSVYIDFAAGDEIVLLEKADMKFSVPSETKDTFIGRGLSGDIYGKSGTISKLIIVPYQIERIQASFANAKVRSKQPNADAVLGNASLKRFNLIFDYANKKLYLKPNSSFKEISDIDRSR